MIFRPWTGIALLVVPGWALKPPLIWATDPLGEGRVPASTPAGLSCWVRWSNDQHSSVSWFDTSGFSQRGRWDQSFSWFFSSWEAGLESLSLKKNTHSHTWGDSFTSYSWFSLHFHASFLIWLLKTWLFVFCCFVFRHHESPLQWKSLDSRWTWPVSAMEGLWAVLGSHPHVLRCEWAWLLAGRD